MRYSLRQFVAAVCDAFTCMGALGSSPAAASSIYTVDYTFISRFGWLNVVTGTIATDGALTELDFDFGPRFGSSLLFKPVGFRFVPQCPAIDECGAILGFTSIFTTAEFQRIAFLASPYTSEFANQPAQGLTK